MTKGTSFLTALAVAAGVGMPLAARAEQERKSPLADAPAVRRRLELRDKRFEIGVGGGATMGQDFYHAVTVNGRLGFHFTDWLAVAGFGAFNLTPNFKTSFHEKLEGALSAGIKGDRAPSVDEANAGMNHIGEIAVGQAELIPFTGKFALFSGLFMNYDFYAFGGLGGVDFKADTVCGTPAMGRSCAVTGWKLAGNFGLGMHMFANDFFALNFELRDIYVKNNAAGRDINGDLLANDRDESWGSNYLLSLNLMFFLPGRATISN